MYAELNNLYRNARVSTDVKLLMNIAMYQRIVEGSCTEDEYDLFNDIWFEVSNIKTLQYIK